MIYERPIQVEFNHCDPAGIVFYPRYFEMVNSVIENFFADVVGRSFASMHFGASNGVPTVAMEAVFQKPSRLGDKVRFTLRIEKVGGSSVRLGIEGHGAEGLRLKVGMTLAWIDGMKAAPWPEEIREALDAYRETQDA
jgi:4-hydroxybenzoyl-CoA thioesterase